MKAALTPLLVLLSLLNACTTTNKLSTSTPNPPSLSELQSTRSIGEEVFWGGEVVKISNYSDHTIIEVVARQLARSGTPKNTDQSEGRFLAKVDSFIDPENLKPGRKITITGKIKDWQTHKIGEYPYLYPLIIASEHKVWPKQRAIKRHYYAPYWDDWGPPYVFGARFHHFNYFGVHNYHWIQ